MFRDLAQLGIVRYGRPIRKTFVETPNEEKQIINKLISPDPRTGLPRNILAIYQSKETSPEVRTFIENNLLQRQQPTVTMSADDYDDDQILNGIPKPFESLNEYDARVRGMLEEDKKNLEEKKREEYIKKKYAKKEE